MDRNLTLFDKISDLTLLEDDYSYMLSENVTYINLQLEYREYCGEDYIDYSYEITLRKGLLRYDYLIVDVFNTTKKKYNKIYYPIKPDRNYTYNFRYPGPVSEQLIQKKYTKEQKKCLLSNE